MSSSTMHPIIQSTESTQESFCGLDSSSLEDNDAAPSTEFSSPQRPLRIYTRPQLLLLSQSPMVRLPPDMPELKVWFGTENETLMNKKDEQSAPNSTRERRFRRDAEDGDTPSRPTFRSTLQPSQMGNFKHQSLRDRDRDREGEKDRDVRDKEGHERLRHLSDKFDRDRLLPLASSRNKDRDSVPHINSSSTRSQTTLSTNGTSRRADAREATKKKVGESTEDWRRGSDPRLPREERPENGRRDREDRDRARSGPRDSSRSKRETSTSRRDEPRERARDRDRDDRRDTSRSRRDREDDDNPRHWRDDGKRDERMAARRERDRARNQDRESDDRRWTPGDERDGGRYKRTTARDRKSGNAGDDGKEKDDRREKEKEPAWMDTYIPNESSSGILGGQAPNGELDGIQAWKKGLKEKEVKDNDGATNASSLSKTNVDQTASADLAEKPLDEIQIFRMLMKKEEDKKRLEGSTDANVGEGTGILSNKENDIGRQPHQQGVVTEDASVSAQVKSLLPSFSPTSTPLDTASAQSLSLNDPAVLASVNMEPLHDRSVVQTGVTPNPVPPEFIVKPSGDPNNSFPPVGSRVLAMKNKAAVPSNPSVNLQSLNGGLQNIIQESPQLSVKNEPMRPHPGFSPFEDPNRPAYSIDDTRDLSMSLNQTNTSQRLPIDQPLHSSMNSQSDTNYNNSLNKGSRLAKIFENKTRDMSVPPPKPQMQGSYVAPSPSQGQRQEMGSFGHSNATHSMEELVAMLSNSSQRNNLGPQSGSSQLLNSNSTTFNSHPSFHSLQQQQLPNTRLEPLYESRTEDRSFMPDGMVPGLRTAPPPRTRDGLGLFNDNIEDQLHYNLQRLAQQQQGRNLEPLFNGPAGSLFNQQSGRHGGGGLPLQSLQQPHYRGGPSPALNTTNPPQQQRLPPGLANLGGRPPHDPSQFIGLQSLPALGAQHSTHGNGPIPQQQLPFNNFNVTNPVGLNTAPHRGHNQNSLLQNTGQQLPLGNLGHHSLDPRLSNHHHMMGIGGSGITGNRINGQFPPQQAPVGPNLVGIRPQQAQLLPQMLPHLMPPHMQQQGPSPSNNPQNHDLMAVLMGGSLRE